MEGNKNRVQERESKKRRKREERDGREGNKGRRKCGKWKKFAKTEQPGNIFLLHKGGSSRGKQTEKWNAGGEDYFLAGEEDEGENI